MRCSSASINTNMIIRYTIATTIRKPHVLTMTPCIPSFAYQSSVCTEEILLTQKCPTRTKNKTRIHRKCLKEIDKMKEAEFADCGSVIGKRDFKTLWKTYLPQKMMLKSNFRRSHLTR